MPDTELDHLLQGFNMPELDMPHLFVLGASDARVTIQAQQSRAINLVHALVYRQILTERSKLAILGGGIAGVTAGVYAKTLGITPIIIEKSSQVMSAQDSSSRVVHPFIYDWPLGTWQAQRTNLPIMNWNCGPVRLIVQEMRAKARETLSSAEVIVNTSADTVTRTSRGLEIGLTSNSAQRSILADVVIVAAGFGVEKNPVPSGYWRDDDTHQAAAGGGSVLVSGVGDGGLIDLIRASIRDFDYDWLVKLGQRGDLEGVRDLFRERAEDWSSVHGDQPSVSEIRDRIPSSFKEWLAGQVRDASFVLNSHQVDVFDRSSSRLNRFIAQALIDIGKCTVQTGRVVADKINRMESETRVVFRDDEGVEVERSFDHVVLRHGVESPRLWTGIPNGVVALAADKDRKRALAAVYALNRSPIWVSHKIAQPRNYSRADTAVLHVLREPVAVAVLVEVRNPQILEDRCATILVGDESVVDLLVAGSLVRRQVIDLLRTSEVRVYAAANDEREENLYGLAECAWGTKIKDAKSKLRRLVLQNKHDSHSVALRLKGLIDPDLISALSPSRPLVAVGRLLATVLSDRILSNTGAADYSLLLNKFHLICYRGQYYTRTKPLLS
jgi:hypothetical protein